MALEGDLTTLPARELLAWLARRRASGTLSLSQGMRTWQLWLRDGRVLLTTTSGRDLPLGRLLVERGLLEEAQLEEALVRSRRSHARLGRTLARAGLVSNEALSAVLAEQVRGVVAEALRWQEGRLFLDDRATPRARPAAGSPLRLAPPPHPHAGG